MIPKAVYDELLADRNHWMREARRWRAEAADAARRIREVERNAERRALDRARAQILGGAA